MIFDKFYVEICLFLQSVVLILLASVFGTNKNFVK